MSSGRGSGRSLIAGVAILALTIAPAQALGAPKLKRGATPSVVPGAALQVSGSGLRGSGITVRVGSARARVLAAEGRTLRFVVPKLRPGTQRLRIRQGGRSTSMALRVLKPFRGTIAVRVDRLKRASRTIGPDGGTITARGRDGTSYRLRVPRGALTERKRILLIPVLSIRGLPLTGGRPAGVDFAPDGLRFAQPAKLVITTKRPFPASVAGFGYAPGAGLDIEKAQRSGRKVTLLVEHFSSSGAGVMTEADFTNAVGPIAGRTGSLSEIEIGRVAEAVAVWSARFKGFCARQPVCDEVVQKALGSIDALVTAMCAESRAAPQLTSVTRFAGLEALRVAARWHGPHRPGMPAGDPDGRDRARHGCRARRSARRVEPRSSGGRLRRPRRQPRVGELGGAARARRRGHDARVR